MRATQSFSVFAGEDVSIPITIVDNSGNTVNVSEATARFVVSRRKHTALVLDSAASPATATCDVGPFAVTVVLADSDTESLLGTYYWELKVTDSSGNEVVTSHGYVTFKPSQT